MQIAVARMCHATVEPIEQDVMETEISDPAHQLFAVHFSRAVGGKVAKRYEW